MIKITLLSLTFFFSSFATESTGFDHKHTTLTALLQNHVKLSADNTSSTVDYKNFDKKLLNKYLAEVSSVAKSDFESFSTEQQLAFYINAYNAYTIKLILNHYPVKSIKKTASFFSSPWKKEFFKLFGKKTSLDEIEHKFVRGSKKLGKDARIHFAFNCASIGCPALLNEAWNHAKIYTQLDNAAKNFLKDRSRNKVSLKDKKVEISNIFKWYRDDFKTKNYESLKDFLTQYIDAITDSEKEKQLILSNDYSIEFSGYNWDLNEQ